MKVNQLAIKSAVMENMEAIALSTPIRTVQGGRDTSHFSRKLELMWSKPSNDTPIWFSSSKTAAN